MTKECGVSGKGVQVGRGFSWITVAREPINAMGVEYEQHDIGTGIHVTTPSQSE